MGALDDVGVLIIGGVAIYFLLKTCMLQQAVEKLQIPELSQMINQLGQMVGATDCPAAPSTGTGGGGTTTPPPTTGGGTVTGGHIYPVVGPIAPTENTRINQAGSGTAGGNSERDNLGFDPSKCNRETTWIFKPGTGGDWSIKTGSHGGSDISLIEYSQVEIDGGGGAQWRCEGPEESYGSISGGSGEGQGPNIGGKAQVGLKSAVWSTGPNTVHQEVWYNENGDGNTWACVASYDGGAGSCNPITCPVPCSASNSKCQDTLRIDNNSGHQFISSNIVEISPGPSRCGGGTVTTSGGGGGTPATTTGNGGSGNGNGNGSGNGNGGSTTPPPTTGTPPSTAPRAGCPARCEPLRLSAPNTYQYCCSTAYTRRSKKIRNYRDLGFRSIIPHLA